MPNSKKPRVIVVDDEVELMRALCDALQENGYHAVGFPNALEALAAVPHGSFDLLLTDLMMPEMNGIDLLRQALVIDPLLVGVIMTGQGTISTAVEAMKSGAYDYILKPFRIGLLLPVLARALELRRLRAENIRLRRYVEAIQFESPRYQMVGASEGIARVVQMIEKVAPTEATVLIRGASGTGKELVARAIHHNSRRREQPLVTINCAALQETLLESELFGHDKGAFTGAVGNKPGLFEVAEGGTLFIDEIAEMPLGMQAKMLRVLEDGHFRHVGGTKEMYADVRIIAATNKPLEAEQKAGRFREDLFYRLNVFTVSIPPLCERRDDIPALVAHFLEHRSVGRGKLHVDSAALDLLVRYHWPGNIRELANVVERAQILAEGNVITPDDLPESLQRVDQPTAIPASSTRLQDLERNHVQHIMEKHHGNKVHAAKALGISRRALYRLLEKYQLGKHESSSTPMADEAAKS